MYICEDNLTHRLMLEEHLNRQILINNWQMQLVLSTACPNDILFDVAQRVGESSLFLLDIELGDGVMSGIELGQRIKEYQPNSRNIFITSYPNMIGRALAYGVEPLGFIDKNSLDALKQSLSHSLNIAYERYLNETIKVKDASKLAIETDGQLRVFLVADIVCFEKVPSEPYIIMHTLNGSVIFRRTIQSILQDYPYFCQCHQSYLINLDHVLKFDKKRSRVYLSDDFECPVSRRHVNKIVRKIST